MTQHQHKHPPHKHKPHCRYCVKEAVDQHDDGSHVCEDHQKHTRWGQVVINHPHPYQQIEEIQ